MQQQRYTKPLALANISFVGTFEPVLNCEHNVMVGNKLCFKDLLKHE